MAWLLFQALPPLLLATGSKGVVLHLVRSIRGEGAALAEPHRVSPALGTEEDQYANLSADDFESMMAPSAASTLWEPPRAECEDAVEGGSCHHAVMWLLMGGFERHPDWYPAYSARSSFRDVQAMLYTLGKGHCKAPCKPAVQRPPPSASTLAASPSVNPAGPPAESLQAAGEPAWPKGCHDAVEGEWCFQSLAWLRSKGIPQHPAWYPELNAESTIAEMQAELHRLGKANCEEPCAPQERPAQGEEDGAPQEGGSEQRAGPPASGSAPEAPAQPEALAQPEAEAPAAPGGAPAGPGEACGDAEPLSQCYLAVKYAMSEGIRTQPDAFPGLQPAATFRQVQESLHLRGRHACMIPCPLPDVRKSVDDMSGEELERYLSGEWDGTVKASEAEGAGDGAAAAAAEAAAAPAAAADAGAPPEGAVAPAAAAEVAAPPEGAGGGAATAADAQAEPTKSEGPPAGGPSGADGDAAADAEAAPSYHQDAPLPAVPSPDQDGRPNATAETAATPAETPQEAAEDESVSVRRDAETLRQHLLSELEKAENETEDPEVSAAIKRTKAEFQALAALRVPRAAVEARAAAEDYEAPAAAATAPMAGAEGAEAPTAPAATAAMAGAEGAEAPAAPAATAPKAGAEGAEAAAPAATGQASIAAPVEPKAASGTGPAGSAGERKEGESEPLPYVDDEGREQGAEEQHSDMERRIRRDLEAQLGRLQTTTTLRAETEEEMTARLAAEVLGESGRARGAAAQEAPGTQQVETEEEMTARLSRQVAEEFGQVQGSQSTTSRAETLEEMTERLSRQVVAEFDTKQYKEE